MEISEKTLDALYELQQKRTQEIVSRGEIFELDGSVKQFKGILDRSSATLIILCEASSPVRPGALLSKGCSSYFVTATKAIAGAITAEVLPVLGHYSPIAQTPVVNHQTGVKSVTLTSSQHSCPLLGLSGSSMKVPANSGLQTGAIIKLTGGYHRVIGIKRDGACNICSLEPYELPNSHAPQLPKHFTDNRTWRVTRSYE